MTGAWFMVGLATRLRARSGQMQRVRGEAATKKRGGCRASHSKYVRYSGPLCQGGSSRQGKQRRTRTREPCLFSPGVPQAACFGSGERNSIAFDAFATCAPVFCEGGGRAVRGSTAAVATKTYSPKSAIRISFGGSDPHARIASWISRRPASGREAL